MRQRKTYSDAKRKELETRAALGPRLGHPKSAHRGPTAPPSTGGPRQRFRAGSQHPTRDSGA